MDEDDYGGRDLLDELAVLGAVDVGGEGILLDGAPARDHDLVRVAAATTTGGPPTPGGAPRHDGLDLLRLLHDLLRHGALDAVARDDDAVLLAGGPALEQLAADAVLEHTRGREHDAAADVLEAVEALERADELEVPGSALPRRVARGFRLGHALAEQPLDVVVHGADVGLVDEHALAREVAGVVDGVALVLAVLAPVFVEDEQQLLGAAEGEDGHEDAPATVEHARDGFHEGLLALHARDVGGDAVGGLGDEHVDLDAAGDLGGHEMAILLARVVAGEEDVEPGDLDEEHGSAKDVAGRVGGDADGRDGVCGVVVDGLDHGEGVEVVLLGVDELGGRVGGGVADAHTVLDEPLVDGLGRVCHEDAAAEVGLGQDIGERGGVVDVETGRSAPW